MSDKPSILMPAAFAPPKAETAVGRLLSQATSMASMPYAHSPEESDVALKIMHALEGLPDGDRKRAVHKMLREHERDLSKREDELRAKRSELEKLKYVEDAYKELVAWADAGAKFEKAGQSIFRDMRKAIMQGRAVPMPMDGGSGLEFRTMDYEKTLLRTAEVFVVQHDWAAAFANAEDVANASFRLPFEVCAFEFQISGRRLVALATENDGKVSFCPFAWTNNGWFIPGFLDWTDGDWTTSHSSGRRLERSFDAVAQGMGDQLRSICIALDAEVATTHVERAPHDGQHGKNIHTPPKGYHIVSLARRVRAPSLPGVVGTGRKIRLHFRRGHWRHFEKSKTWIRWMLVGDPDLGFIDKEYRL